MPMPTAAAIAILGTLVSGGAAFAQSPRVIQTACDTLVANPLTVRIEFAVDNRAPSTTVWVVQAWPESCDGAGGTCCALDCGGPVGWTCTIAPDQPHGPVLWMMDLEGCCLDEGERQDGFSVVYQPGECCFAVYVLDTVMGRSPWWERACFVLDETVAAIATTWGQLKATYR